MRSSGGCCSSWRSAKINRPNEVEEAKSNCGADFEPATCFKPTGISSSSSKQLDPPTPEMIPRRLASF